MNKNDDVIQRLKQGEFTDDDVALLSDDDIRQLVIYYATLVRRRAPSGEVPDEWRNTAAKIGRAWNGWPRPLWDRFYSMVVNASGDREKFWSRPADLNNKFGIG